MKSTKIAAFALLVSAITAGCGAVKPQRCVDTSCLGTVPEDDLEAKSSAVTLSVGTFHYKGSGYQCAGSSTWFFPEGDARVVMTTIPDPAGGHYWKVSLTPDFTAMSGYNVNWATPGDVLLHDAGGVAYNDGQAPGYVHNRSQQIEYTHQGVYQVADIQALPPGTGTQYGRLDVAISPYGTSNPAYGECAERVFSYLYLVTLLH